MKYLILKLVHYFFGLQIFVSYISISFYSGFWKYFNPYVRLVGIGIYLLFEIAYTLTSFMDPGIITKEYYLENYDPSKTIVKNYRICRKCNIVMDLDKKVEHCINCNICIIGNDHHCPWTSKCIGEKNILMFRIFIFSLFFHLLFVSFGLILMSIFINRIKKI